MSTNLSTDQREALIAFLRENLTLESRTESVYTGGMDDSGRMYRDSITIQLLLDGEVISEVGV
jgi:hypothetical protein